MDAVGEVVQRCQDHCMGPDGPGGALKTVVDRWSGAIALGGKIIGYGFALLAIAVTVSVALMPWMVRSSVAAAAKEVVPGLVDSAVASALRRHGIAEQTPPEEPTTAIVQAPRAPWIFPQAHADPKGVSP